MKWLKTDWKSSNWDSFEFLEIKIEKEEWVIINDYKNSIIFLTIIQALSLWLCPFCHRCPLPVKHICIFQRWTSPLLRSESCKSCPRMCKWCFWLVSSNRRLCRRCQWGCYGVCPRGSVEWPLMAWSHEDIPDRIFDPLWCNVSSYQFNRRDCPWRYIIHWSFCLPPTWPCNSRPWSNKRYVRIDEFSFPMKLSLVKMPLINNPIIHEQFTITMVPPFFELSFISIP